MKKTVWLSMLLLLLMTTMACKIWGIEIPPATDESPAATSEGKSGSSSDEVKVTIKNISPEDACAVYITSVEDDEWGDNLLEDTLSNGDSKTFTFDAGTYDVDVDNCDGVVIATAWEIDSSTTVQVGESGATTRLTVENATDTEICYLYVSPLDSEEWGGDQLGDMEQIPVGELRMFFVEPGVYDLLAADCEDNTLLEEYEVDLNSDMSWTIQ
ncbi:MAG: hypothetical protein JXA21_08775 [Anaerolineae bacterium]|nr:hypothetical protein [Anaerolineae bacterium]